MVDDRFSCIKEVTKTVHLTLPTGYCANESSGVSEALESWKRQYIHQLQGIVVNYKNVSVTSKYGYIKLDCPVIHCDVKATFELFNPSIGSIAKGKINRVSHDYISCLLHNTINVMIDVSEGIPSDISKYITLDRSILFQITHLEFKRKIIHVRGKITEECANLMIDLDMLNDPVENNHRTYSDSSQDYTSVKRSNNANVAPSSSAQSSSLEPGNSTDMSNCSSSSSKKKKSKKSKDHLLSSPPLFNESLESDLSLMGLTQLPSTTSKKKHKKSKTEIIATEMLNVINDNSFDSAVRNDHTHTDSSSIYLSSTESQNKKKSKKSRDTPTSHITDIQNSSLDQQNSANMSSPSSSTKKKKHKKTKDDFLNSSSNVNELHENKGNGDDLMQFPESVVKKKHKKSKSVDKQPINNLSHVLKDKEIHPNLTENLMPVTISNNILCNADEMMETSHEPSHGDQLIANKFSESNEDLSKQAKKRKRESLDTESLPKKKRKVEGKSSSENKDKTHKKKKKRDKKKKSKDKVLSTKKRLQGYKVKLKKKNKNEHKKSKKLKKNKSDKNEKNVP